MSARVLVSGALRVGLLVAAGLYVLDLLPALALGLPRGVRPCAGPAEAQEALGATLLVPSLPAAADAAWRVWLGPAPAAEVEVRSGSLHARVWQGAGFGDPISDRLRPPSVPFDEIGVDIAGRPARLLAVTTPDGATWEELRWQDAGRNVEMRWRGRTTDALALARSLHGASR